MKRKSMDEPRMSSSAKRVRFAEYSQLALTEPGSVVSNEVVVQRRIQRIFLSYLIYLPLLILLLYYLRIPGIRDKQ